MNKRIVITISVIIGILLPGGLLNLGLSYAENPKDSGPWDKAGNNISILLAGDAIITQPWSQIKEKEFLHLINKIQEPDVSIVNLEMLINDFEGYPQFDSGGTYLSSRSIIANELKWAGFDMVAHANNHTFDYGSEGVIKNLQNVKQAGLILAGSGNDLQSARSPAYFHSPAGTVALISAAQLFYDYMRAGPSRHDFRGRPGLNPLRMSKNIKIPSRFKAYESSKVFVAITKLLKIIWTPVYIIDTKDLEGNLNAIREAKSKADIVVMSVHAHFQGDWLEELSHKAIDSGVDIFFAQCPHEVRGIEIYKDKPIFYGLGDFVFQNEQVEFFPAEFYERLGLDENATPKDATNVAHKEQFSIQKIWEGVVGTIYFEEGKVSKIQLIPIDLGFGQPLPIRGRPKYANNELGKKIISDIIKLSDKYGTKINYSESENIGIIKIN